MGKIKQRINSKKIYTLNSEDLRMLSDIGKISQEELNRLSNLLVSRFLKQIAVERFEYATNCDLQFSVDFEKDIDNFSITNISK